MKPLYQITNEYLKLYDDFMSFPDMPTEAITAELGDMAVDLENKAINVAAFIKNLEAEAEAIKEFEKEMCVRRKSAELRAENLKKYLIFNLQQCNIEEIKTSPMFKISLGKNPPRVVVENENEIPQKYIKVSVEEKISLSELSKDLKMGLDVPGARLEQTTKLTIK